jgi:hypothetical protein
MPTEASVASGVSFERDIAPILEKRCAVCHLTGDEPGGMALGAAPLEAEFIRGLTQRIKAGAPRN